MPKVKLSGAGNRPHVLCQNIKGVSPMKRKIRLRVIELIKLFVVDSEEYELIVSKCQVCGQLRSSYEFRVKGIVKCPNCGSNRIVYPTTTLKITASFVLQFLIRGY